jgi:thiamine transport system substrate-binding protein
MNLIRLIPAEGEMNNPLLCGLAKPKSKQWKWRASQIALLLALLSMSCTQKPGNLTVWTYDSFVSEWGPAPQLAKLFETQTGTKVEFVSKGDGGALLASVLSAGKKLDADLVIGLDDNQLQRALDSKLFAKVEPAQISELKPELIIDATHRLLPFDYGNFAFIWDSQSKIKTPASLEDLVKPEYGKQIILMDPRTSTPGLGFLAWTQAVYKEAWKDYWKRLAPSVLAMTPGWDTGYGLFTKGEAPLVISYSTSPAYHKSYENSERYKTLVFAEGHPAQIELAGVVSKSGHRKQAEAFLGFLLSKGAQGILPETQWMYPANSSAALPDSFSVVPSGIHTIATKLFDPVHDPDEAAAILSSSNR